MKLLFDQNLSFRLPRKIASMLPESNQVSLLNSIDRSFYD